ncbi:MULTISPECIES: phosphatidylglycerophosphatase A [unclassified Acinetobacter]|uniref:phosphatidylglycerophosphatase A family protein n=1 Tax=unclassified Acinetobacter TaxID=196816 RepID=UPI0035B7EF3B
MTQHKPDVRKANPCPPCSTDAKTFEKIIYWLGIGLGSGLPRRAAGTWGTVGGLAVGIIVFVTLGLYAILAFIAVGLLVGNYICGKTSDLMHVHDDPHIVFDEWVGMWITLLPMFYLSHLDPLKTFPLTDFSFWANALIAFSLFRAFDIIKPFPISWADKHVSGGFGIMLDDILAGIMAMISHAGLIALMAIAICSNQVC